MKCESKCYYREDRIPGDGTCYLGLTGPMEVCQGWKAPAVVSDPPLDLEWAKKFGVELPGGKGAVECCGPTRK